MRAQTVVTLLLDSDELPPEDLLQQTLQSIEQKHQAASVRERGPFSLWWSPHQQGFQGGRQAPEMFGREAYFSTLDDAVAFAAENLNPAVDTNIEIWAKGGEHIYSLDWTDPLRPVAVESGY